MKVFKSSLSKNITYQFIQSLGEGLTSRVFKATKQDQKFKFTQNLVVKMLKPGLNPEILRYEFLNLSQIDSRFCVRPLSFDVIDKNPCILLEFIDGVSLYELANHISLTSELKNEILAQLQNAIKDLFSYSIVHGDLAPKNILINRKGQIKLIDFASSHHLFENKESNTISATAAFMAPELWKGSQPNLYSDLFSLGLIERYFQTNFSSVPSEHFQCERYSNLSIDDSHPWLCSQPNQRKFRDLIVNEKHQIELAKLINQYWPEDKNEMGVRTQNIQFIKKENSFYKKYSKQLIGTAAASFILATVIFSFRAIYSPKQVQKSKLEVRTQNWVSFYLDSSKNEEDSPFEIQVKPGVHKLKWRSAKKSGELEIKLESGENRILSDLDFNLEPPKLIQVKYQPEKRFGPQLSMRSKGLSK